MTDQSDQSKQLRVILEAPEDVPTYYINYAEVTHSPHDFAVLLTRLPAKLAPAQLEDVKEVGELRVEAVLQVVFSPSFVHGLLRALNVQKELYESRFGSIKDLEGENAGK